MPTCINIESNANGIVVAAAEAAGNAAGADPAVADAAASPAAVTSPIDAAASRGTDSAAPPAVPTAGAAADDPRLSETLPMSSPISPNVASVTPSGRAKDSRGADTKRRQPGARRRAAWSGRKKTSQGEAVRVRTMRVAGLAITRRAVCFAPQAGGRT